MSKLKSATIKNFKQHKHLDLEFHPKLTAISGPSGIGKSASLRAIRWTLMNKPLGSTVFPKNLKTTPLTEVGINIDDRTISRLKSSTVNSYVIDNETELVSFKSDVPELVQLITNISDYNIQTQFDRHFLLFDTPGERAKKLNDVASLSIIDETRQKVDKKIASIASNIKTVESQIAQETHNIDILKEYKQPYDQISELLNHALNIEKESSKIEEIENIIYNYNKISERINRLSYIVLHKDDVKNLLIKSDELELESKKVQIVKSLISSLTNCENKIKYKERLRTLLDKTSELIEEYQDLKTDEDNYSIIYALINSYERLNKDILSKNKSLSMLRKECESIKTDMKVCPLCQKPF